jgi:putative pyruvate formate lyase activating enzyme
MLAFEPAYLATHRSGLLRRKAQLARERLAACNLCPRRCGVDRLAGATGVCRTGGSAWISSFNPHFGEEDPLVGEHGSGTVFFTHCNLLCLFCQNFDISHQGIGQEVDDDQLADIMLVLQRQGCHNINFVTPTHVVPQILAALDIAASRGLNVPLVYNSGGYDLPETLKLLEGVIDIYMPDFKFWDPEISRKACDAPDYPEVARRALKEMHRQVGDLVVNGNGIARRGLLVRHLVMPGGMADTRAIMRFIACEISRHTYVNLMSQYRPCGRANEVPGLETPLSATDYRRAVNEALEEGITRLDRPHRVWRWV